jgi:hypothetical protein
MKGVLERIATSAADHLDRIRSDYWQSSSELDRLRGEEALRAAQDLTRCKEMILQANKELEEAVAGPYATDMQAVVHVDRDTTQEMTYFIDVLASKLSQLSKAEFEAASRLIFLQENAPGFRDIVSKYRNWIAKSLENIGDRTAEQREQLKDRGSISSQPAITIKVPINGAVVQTFQTNVQTGEPAGRSSWGILLATSTVLARECIPLLLSIEQEVDGGWRSTRYNRSKQVEWCGTSPKMLPDVDHDFQFLSIYEGENRIRLLTVPQLNEFANIFEQGNSYRLVFQIVGPTARSDPFAVRLTWGGNWNDISVVPLEPTEGHG